MTRCETCNGNGWITKVNPDRLLRGHFEVDCPDCNGSGLPRCDECGEPSEYLDEAGLCEECAADPVEMQRAYDDYRAGIGRPQEEIDRDLINAGRGHLIRRTW